MRIAAGLSGRELARRAGLSPGYPWHIESGRVHQIGSGAATALAEALGCSLEYLLRGAGDPPSVDAPPAT